MLLFFANLLEYLVLILGDNMDEENLVLLIKVLLIKKAFTLTVVLVKFLIILFVD